MSLFVKFVDPRQLPMHFTRAKIQNESKIRYSTSFKAKSAISKTAADWNTPGFEMVI